MEVDAYKDIALGMGRMRTSSSTSETEFALAPAFTEADRARVLELERQANADQIRAGIQFAEKNPGRVPFLV